jgi:hypothetical protein
MPRDPAKDWTIPPVEFSSVTSDAGIFSFVIFLKGAARPLQSSTAIVLIICLRILSVALSLA